MPLRAGHTARGNLSPDAGLVAPAADLSAAGATRVGHWWWCAPTVSRHAAASSGRADGVSLRKAAGRLVDRRVWALQRVLLGVSERDGRMSRGCSPASGRPDCQGVTIL